MFILLALSCLICFELMIGFERNSSLSCSLIALWLSVMWFVFSEKAVSS